MLNQSERLQLPEVYSFGCHRTMSGRAFSIWKVQLRKVIHLALLAPAEHWQAVWSVTL